MLRLLEPLAPAVAVIVLAATAAAASSQDTFAACEEQLAMAPQERESAACFYRTARDTGLWGEARQHLQSHLERAPENPWLHYYLGNVGWGERRPEVADHYREAARLLAGKGRHAEEVEARLNLASYVRILGRLERAQVELEAARKAAAELDDPVLRNRVDIELARLLINSGRALGRSYRLLRSVESTAFPEGDYVVQRDCLIGLSMVSFLLGRSDETLRYRRRLAELTAAAGDRYAEAAALFNLANTLLSRGGDEARAEAVHLGTRALDAAIAAGHRTIEARAHRLLGRLRGGAPGIDHLELCLEIARELDQSGIRSQCLRALAAEIAAEEPRRAEALLDEALALAFETQDPWDLVFAWIERKEVRWVSRPRDEALTDSLKTLQSIEALRSLQSTADDRIAFLSVWSEAYYWLAGRLLAEESPPPRSSVEQAFHLTERIRSRGLLEMLAEDRRRQTIDAAQRQRHAAELREIVALNRRLLSADLSPDERRSVVEELGRHERAERELRLESAGERVVPAFAELGEIERQLDEHQAMLSFQLAEWTDIYGDFAGGSWLLVSTRAGTTAYRLPPPSELEPAVEIFRGLVGRRQGLEHAAASGLYERLLRSALEHLPKPVEELLIVPDGALHRLPFAALRAAAGDPPLGLRFRIAHVPSATLWLEWQRRPPPMAPRPALVLADPALPGVATASGVEQPPVAERAWSLAMGARLGPLPHARREGRSVARRLAGDTALLEGAGASEHRIKGLDLSRFAILHFATHAVVDDEWPERSAVLLSAGAADEDGLLQAREIVELDLDGQLVVLSACRSAGGAVLRGEGAMSLARAFFAGGAQAVLASLWPLRDDEAAALVSELYRELSTGATVGRALSAAGRTLAARGEPTAAWAGLVLLGDGELRPAAAPEPGLAPAWMSGLVFILAAAALVWWLRRSSHPWSSRPGGG